MIDGVLIEPLKRFANEKGDVLHIMRNDAPFFKKFGEVYCSYVLPGFVKGWKKHKRMTQHFAVPSGNVKVVLYDERKASRTHDKVLEVEIGEDNYQLLCMPPDIWYSFAALNNEKALIVNCTDLAHDSDESVQIDLNDESIPYKWKVD